MYTVLLVDDEARVLDDLEQQVEWKKLGIRRLLKASSVKQALSMYDSFRPDLIVSDIEMLQENGLELLKNLREKNETVAFLFLTCHPEFEYMQRAMQLGSCDYILKPVDYAELEASLHRQIERMESTRKKEDTGMGTASLIRGSEDLSFATKQYIADHLVQRIAIADISEALGVSESHLMKSFKKETGWSIVEYITKKRIEMAGGLLKSTDWNIQMIANMCGYEDGQYFSRIFKKVTGESPKDFQRRHREAGIRLYDRH